MWCSELQVSLHVSERLPYICALATITTISVWSCLNSSQWDRSWRCSVVFLSWQGDRVFVSRFCCFFSVFFFSPVSSGGITAEKITSSCSLRSGYQISFVPEGLWRLTGAEVRHKITQEFSKNPADLTKYIKNPCMNLRLWSRTADDGWVWLSFPSVPCRVSVADDALDGTNHHRVKKLMLLVHEVNYLLPGGHCRSLNRSVHLLY